MINRRKFLKSAGLFVASAPAIIKPSCAQILQFSGSTDGQLPSDIPLNYNADQFSNNTVSGAVTLSPSQVFSDKSITVSGAPGQPASIIMANNSVISNCRVNSDECVRCGAGTFTIEDSYLEATGVPGDHADVIQLYAGGPARFVLNISRTSVVAHTADATAGLFVADDCTGDIYCTDVVFNGGPYGCKIHADLGGDNRIWFNRVYFVPPFGYGPYEFLDFGGHTNVIMQWTDVYNATIVGNTLIPGTPLSPP